MSELEWGTWNAICDVCGFKYKANQMQKRWDGKMVCKDDWETRHPQDLIKVPKDEVAVPWTRPEQTDVFIEPSYVAPTVGTQAETTPPAGHFEVNNGLIS